MLTEFVALECERFSNRDNNLFGICFSQITRYYEFIRIIQLRNKKVATEFIENTKAQQAMAQPGTHQVTQEEWDVLMQGREICAVLHLEIESYYLFAKILLDKIARAIEFYFGPARKLSLDSHDDLVKNIQNYISTKGLSNLPDRLKEDMQSLKQLVSDYRDYEIAHDKSPRAMKVTMFNLNSKNAARIASTRIYPTANDKQVESKEIDEIMELIDKYIGEILTYIKKNNNKTNLDFVSKSGHIPIS